MLFVSALAETNRPRFELPEAESELVAGYQVEYSATPCLLFMFGEYLNIVLMCAMMTLLFLGGWHGVVPLPQDFVDQFPLWMIGLGHLTWFALKMLFFFFMFAIIKAMVPRYRYDQLMRLGWKIFLPTALVAVVLVGGYVVYSGVEA